MRMVRRMCGTKVKDRFKKPRERLIIDDIALVLQQTGCDDMGMCCKKKMMIG